MFRTGWDGEQIKKSVQCIDIDIQWVVLVEWWRVKPLADTPDKIVTITDDTEAKVLMVQQGILDMVIQAEREHRGKIVKKGGTSVLDDAHPTHWIIVETYWGFDKPGDNGYVVICVPKSRFSKEEFADGAGKMFQKLYRGPITAKMAYVNKTHN